MRSSDAITRQMHELAASLAIIIQVLSIVLSIYFLSSSAASGRLFMGPWLPRPMAIVCIGLLGLALFLKTPQNTYRMRKECGNFIALLVGGVSILVLAEYGGIDVGIDDLFVKVFADRAGSIGMAPPGRMWPTPALVGVLYSIALLTLGRTIAGWSISRVCTLTAASFLTPCLFGHAFGIAALCNVNSFIYSPLFTSIALLMLGLAIMLCRIERGATSIFVQDSSGGRMIRRIVFILFAYPCAIALVRVISDDFHLISEDEWKLILSIAVLLPAPALIWKLCTLINELDRERLLLLDAQNVLSEHMKSSNLSARIGRALVQAATLHELLQECAEAIVELLDVAFARIWTVDNNGNVLVLQASAGLYTHLDGYHSRIAMGQYKVGMIAAEKCPHLTNDVVNDERISDRDWAKREGMVAFAGYPLLVGGSLVGVVAAFSRHKLNPSMLNTMASVSDVIALGIKRKSTEHIHSEAAALINATGDAIIGKDVSGLITQWNPAAESIFRYSAQETIGKPLSMLIPPDLREELHKIESKLGEGGDTIDFEMSWIGRNQSLIDLSISESIIKGENGSCIGACLIARDITDRRKREELFQSQFYALQEKTEELQSINDAMAMFLSGAGWESTVKVLIQGAVKLTQSESGFVAVLNQNGGLEITAQVSDVEDLMKRREEETVTRFNINGSGILSNLCSTVLKQGLPVTSLKSKKGKARSGSSDTTNAELFLGLPLLEGTSVAGLVVLSKCGHQYNQEDIRKSQVLTQTASILHQAYKRKLLQDEAEKTATQLKLMQGREEFMFTLTHDMKNPLIGANRIIEQLAAQEFGPLCDQAAQILIKLRDSNNKLIDLIHSIVEVYRYERDIESLEAAELDLCMLVRECLLPFTSIARSRGITLSTDFSTDGALVFADMNSIRRVVQNLMDNAVKFSPDGSEVSISVHGREDEVKLIIHNFGEPISEAEQRYLFQRFWQGVRGKRYVAGSGLGLYLCHKIVTAHGGSIACSSDAARGTTFSVTLPLIAKIPAAIELNV